ncbi:MAG: hypothetical protein RLY61_900 [Candidatus Parcubacteria bacterium]|jgi:hypothetical protein
MSFYYAADGKKFNSKIEALKYKNSTGIQIGLYYHDDVYSKVDWKTEPPGSLDFYYKEQAQRLRDQYDYLILCYSGGYDSTNILETFFYNNIKLDKIVIVGAFSQDSEVGSDENHNGELYNNAFPTIKKMGLESITEIYDYTERFDNIDSFSISQYSSEWTHTTGGWFSPHNWWWKDAGNIIVPKNLGSKRAAIIFGRDKPTVVGKKFYFYDTAITSYGNIQSSDNYDVINFYWDPNFTPILVKQLHVLKNTPNVFLPTVEKYIYNLKNPLIFKSPKSPTTLLSLRDQYLHKKKNSRVHDLYVSGLKNISSFIDPRQMRTIHSVGYSFF